MTRWPDHPIRRLVFIGVHVKYREITPIIMSGVLGLLMAFIAYGRSSLSRSSERRKPGKTGSFLLNWFQKGNVPSVPLFRASRYR